jgi:ferredoxin-type protein NapH
MAVPVKMSSASPDQCGQCGGSNPRKWIALRPWVQTAFLLVWLAPLGRWLHTVPSCVFHCYSCPLSSFACPIGLMANYAAIIPAVPTIPFLLIGVLVVVGGLAGALVCGWACPFGFVQDLLGKIRKKKIPLPSGLGHFRYVVLVGLVLLLPWVLGSRGILYDEQTISICRLCPAGALEAGLPHSLTSLLSGNGWMMSSFKTALLTTFLISAVVIYRPWCRLFCPLGGLLALFNPFSLFHLRYNAKNCSECSLCRSRCPVGVKLDLKANAVNCIRCLDCTACGAIEPRVALPGVPRGNPDAAKSA